MLDAAGICGIPLTVACQPRNLRGLEVPGSVTVVHGVYGEAYRRLLASADLVVTPTTAPAYPSGQSVVLEAMAMGRPTLTTDSAAMREYVTDDVTGVLVAPADPQALARSVAELMSDPARRDRMGAAGHDHVHEQHGFEQMWTAVGDVLTSAIDERAAAS